MSSQKRKSKVRESVHNAFTIFALNSDQLTAVITILTKKYNWIRLNLADVDLEPSMRKRQESYKFLSEDESLDDEQRALSDPVVLNVVKNLEDQLKSEIQQKTHRVRFNCQLVREMLEAKDIHRLYLKALEVMPEFAELEKLYNETYGPDSLVTKITKQSVDKVQTHARGLNEVIRTSSSPDYREAMLRKSIVQNRWIQRCLRGASMPKFTWEINIQMSFFRCLILTALKYGKEELIKP